MTIKRIVNSTLEIAKICYLVYLESHYVKNIFSKNKTKKSVYFWAQENRA